MSIKAILFDLDGTLLPMDQKIFTKTYFTMLAQWLTPHGYAPETVVDAIWEGSAAMVKNDGRCMNEDAFWETFARRYPERDIKADIPLFDAFYREQFPKVQPFCGFHPMAADVIRCCKQKGLRLVLATNPLFPRTATEQRTRWAGADPSDFEWITTYENSRYCKPNPAYYAAIVEQLGVNATECMMVGNDVSEDMIAEMLGMQVFLLSDCLINKTGKDISCYPNGGFEQLLKKLNSISC